MSAPALESFKLDAFGHLTWGLGFEREDGDWSAWLDCDRQGDWVAYHVVVDSDSGGFCMTAEADVIHVDQARKDLPGLYDTWTDVASEHLDAAWTEEEAAELLKVGEAWKARVAEVTEQALDPC